MKLTSYLRNQTAIYGIAVESGILDIPAIDANAPASIVDFICLRNERPKEFSRLLDTCQSGELIPHTEIQFLPCIPRPSKVICLGVNYHDHAAEGGNKVADYPTIFLRGPSSLLGHMGKIPVSHVSDKLDFEAELALVIGKSARYVSEKQALDYVFGYSCFNDATFRDYQRKTTQWTIGKNFDATGGFGPWIISADALPPGAAGLHIESRLNGRVMQSASTEDMVFAVAQTVSLMSQCMTLEPGDVILMGTPAGVGYARTPPVWMKPGDVIEIEIETIGTLRNTVVGS
jgi:2-keto-4-pentenoate hydratase/2-oxohepta-3-ene-1,7-dioic acid hydratase in catechol pathway